MCVCNLECVLVGVGDIGSITIHLILSDSVYHFPAFIEELRHILEHCCKIVFSCHNTLIDFAVRALQCNGSLFCADTVAVIIVIPDGGDRDIHSGRYIVVCDGEAVFIRTLYNLVSIRIAVGFL